MEFGLPSLGRHGPLILYSVLAGLAGYYLGYTAGQKYEYESDSEEDDETVGDGDGQAYADSTEECKMVLVVRQDLQMGKGKIAAQCAHAAVACYEAAARTTPELLQRWKRLGQAKIALKAPSQEDLELLQAIAFSKGITAKTIIDAGRTQIAAGSMTVLGIGPAPKSAIDEVTGGLQLL